jgi:hypothetical protein
VSQKADYQAQDFQGLAKVKRWCKRPPVRGANREAEKPRLEQSQAVLSVFCPAIVGQDAAGVPPVIPHNRDDGTGGLLESSCEAGSR